MRLEKILKTPPYSILIGVSAFILIALFKQALINIFAVDLPWTDQWDHEIKEIYFKYLDGTLSLSDFWAPSNEHHQFLGKLLAFISFLLGGEQYNQIRALTFNSITFALPPAVLIYVLNKEKIRIIPSILILIIFSLPISWENLYWSYQNQMAISLFLALLGIYFISQPSISIYAITFITSLAAINNAAAFYIPLIAMLATLVYGYRTATAYVKALYFGIIALLTYLLAVNPAPWHDIYKVKTLSQLWHSILIYSNWPQGFGYLIWPLLAASALFILWNLLNGKRSISFIERYGLWLSAWFFLFLISTIYSRGVLFEGVSNRYLDYYLPGLTALIFLNLDVFYGSNSSIYLQIKRVICAAFIVFMVKETWLEIQQGSSFQKNKALYRENLISTLTLIQNNPDIRLEQVIENMSKVPLPYAGYPNYEVPAQVLMDKKSWHIFRYMLTQKHEP